MRRNRTIGNSQQFFRFLSFSFCVCETSITMKNIFKEALTRKLGYFSMFEKTTLALSFRRKAQLFSLKICHTSKNILHKMHIVLNFFVLLFFRSTFKKVFFWYFNSQSSVEIVISTFKQNIIYYILPETFSSFIQ